MQLRQDFVNVQQILRSEGSNALFGKRSIFAVLPAYNAEKTLASTLADIPRGCVDAIMLVDDCSTDRTVELAEAMGLDVVVHSRNRGYGGNQKTCYRRALECGADIIVMLHPDYQYDSRVIPHAIAFVELGICDIVLGNRIRSFNEAREGGMPIYKYFSNRVLTFVENFALGQNLGDFHSGFRVYRREVLERIPFECNSDGFVFDTQLLAQAVRLGFRLGDIPMPARYFPEASSINFTNSLKYGVASLGVLLEYWADRLKVRRSPRFAMKE